MDSMTNVFYKTLNRNMYELKTKTVKLINEKPDPSSNTLASRFS